MSSNNEVENTNNSPDELSRIDNFVKIAPGNEYTIDQKSQQLCREGKNGQTECVKLNLECKYPYYALCVRCAWMVEKRVMYSDSSVF